MYIIYIGFNIHKKIHLTVYYYTSIPIIRGSGIKKTPSLDEFFLFDVCEFLYRYYCLE